MLWYVQYTFYIIWKQSVLEDPTLEMWQFWDSMSVFGWRQTSVWHQQTPNKDCDLERSSTCFRGSTSRDFQGSKLSAHRPVVNFLSLCIPQGQKRAPGHRSCGIDWGENLFPKPKKWVQPEAFNTSFLIFLSEHHFLKQFTPICFQHVTAKSKSTGMGQIRVPQQLDRWWIQKNHIPICGLYFWPICWLIHSPHLALLLRNPRNTHRDIPLLPTLLRCPAAPPGLLWRPASPGAPPASNCWNLGTDSG